MPPILFRLAGPNLNTSSGARRGVPPNLCGDFPLPARSVSITGVSRDSTGAPLGGCTCTLFRVTPGATDAAGVVGLDTFTQVATTVSDGSGNYSFVVGFHGPYRVTFDLDGAPVRAGLTLKTLSGV